MISNDEVSEFRSCWSAATGMKLVSSVPSGETIVSVISKGDGVIVATDKYIYTMGKDKIMRRVMFELPE